MVKLSIIVPVYNVSDYIRQCIESLCNQDIAIDEYEIIVVDDCSEDDSIQIVRQLCLEHKNIRIIELPVNHRLGGARNAGLREAAGKYVWFVDSDDYIYPNVIGGLLKELEEKRLDFLMFDYSESIDVSIVERDSFSETGICSGPELFFNDHIPWWREQIVVWRKIYRLDFLRMNNITFAEGVMFEDNDYSIKIYACADRIIYKPTKAYIYRINASSFTRRTPSVNHVRYHMELCYRLLSLKEWIVTFRKDDRFISLVDSFIRSEIRIAAEICGTLEGNERRQAKTILRDSQSSLLRRYFGRKLYYQVRLGII